MIGLPPKERACVLLKDVFDYSLEEIADLVDSTVGGVKAALNRGRAKLAATSPGTPNPSSRCAPSESWNYSASTSNGSIGAIGTVCANSPAPTRACASPTASQDASPTRPISSNTSVRSSLGAWRSANSTENTVVIILRDETDGLTPFSVIRLDVAGGRIARITDYIKSPWILEAAHSIAIEQA